MNGFDTKASASIAQDTFLNGQGLEAVKKMGRDKDPEALRQMARQFESLFVQQMLKSMRAASESFGEGNYMNSSETQFYSDMLDQQWSLELSKGRGMGLADTLYQQLLKSYGQYLPNDKTNDVSSLDPFAQPQALQFDSRRVSQRVASISEPVKTLTGQPNAPQTVAEAPAVATGTAGFIDAIRPYANWAAQTLGVAPQALMAQAALETGWGKHLVRDDAGSSFNLFNIKAGKSWSGDTVTVKTTEYADGEAQSVEAAFRRYGSLQESFSDYIELMQKPRYQNALAQGKDAEAYVEQLQHAGYATDPQYANKLKSIMQREDFAGSNAVAAYQQHVGNQ
ncbi:flagellar assembly peptidoglycan hydrolase FlgJ [Gilvimarinus agarilyticus]|uniref:flagellar assembly peptidoglycan hydrolase FlgJ n=1 Tax=Gilvimarinus agarilyticus TaxID=679259 RepID=UPI000697A96B|nr:flagellar assembly peptidoglycan hydrolase FlgJ [Gilvimarinus agarilyticus]